MAKKKKDDPLAGIPDALHPLCRKHRLPDHFDFKGATYGTVAHWQGKHYVVNLQLIRETGAKSIFLRRLTGKKPKDTPYFKEDDLKPFVLNHLAFQSIEKKKEFRLRVYKEINTMAEFKQACELIARTCHWSIEEASSILDRYGLEAYFTRWLPAREMGESAVLEEVSKNFLHHHESGNIVIRNPSRFFLAALNDDVLKAQLLVDAL